MTASSSAAFKQETVEELAGTLQAFPVFNGLTDDGTGLQMLCDLLTMKEASGKTLEKTSLLPMSETLASNTGNSCCSSVQDGYGCSYRCPKAYWPSQELIDMCREFLRLPALRSRLLTTPEAAVKGVDFIHTDIWVSMGEPKGKFGTNGRKRFFHIKSIKTDGSFRAIRT